MSENVSLCKRERDHTYTLKDNEKLNALADSLVILKDRDELKQEIMKILCENSKLRHRNQDLEKNANNASSSHFMEDARKRKNPRIHYSSPMQIEATEQESITDIFLRFPHLGVFGLMNNKDFFHAAAKYGHLEICRFILENTYPDTGPGDTRGRLPLHYAAEYGRFEMCKLIMEKYDDKNMKDERGETPFDIAKNTKDRYGNTPLDLADEKEHWSICQLLTKGYVDEVQVDRKPWYR